jgi:hypothetical protein
MTLDNFRQSLTATEPPAGLTLALAGLWWDAKNDWTRAHESAQRDEGRDGSWVIRIEAVSLRLPNLNASLVDTISCRIYSSRHYMNWRRNMSRIALAALGFALLLSAVPYPTHLVSWEWSRRLEWNPKSIL